jgi:hypothetical protein
MNAIDTSLPGAAAAAHLPRKGPVTRARQRRTALIYAGMVAAGLVAVASGSAGPWQALGLGLWMPGAGFLAVGGWAALLFPLTLILFTAACVAWFWAGMVVAPVGVWLGSAAIAAAIAGPQAAGWAPVTAGLAVLATGLLFRRRTARLRREGAALAARRAAYVPASLRETEQLAARAPDPAAREMTAEQLASLRYLLDRALAPVDDWGGFDVVEQFQPAALRYQLNHMGFALALAQGRYAPAFHGYLRQAQRNLITRYLDRKVWGYWVYESCWGHLNFRDWDPASRDNIMLTGWFGMHVGAYMLNSGDRHYLEPGSLTFRLNARTAYRHDFRSLVGSVSDNYAGAEFGLYACEPNWIYPICNHYGMGALAVHDRVTGSALVARHMPGWQAGLDTEFTDESGSIIGLRSQLTGLPVPFPVTESGYAPFENIFAPERARRLWATARREIEPLLQMMPDGTERLVLPGRGLDTGNYKPGHTAAYASIMLGAREFGDDRIADAAHAALMADGQPTLDGGVRRYLAGSNAANSYAVLASLTHCGDFAATFAAGPPPAALAGPVIADAPYPAVLVARAWSDGHGLEAVLLPGGAPGLQVIGLAQLSPGRTYAVRGGPDATLVADAAGQALLTVDLSGRTELMISPA